MDLRGYLQIARRRWMLILASFVLCILAATAYTLRTTPLYASTARLFVSTPADATSQAYQGGLFSQQRVTSYANLIRGNTVAELVIGRLHLTESPNALASEVSATVVPNTVILEVTITNPDPNRARQLAQSYADVFVKYIGQLETAPGQANAPIKATVVGAATLPVSPVSPRPVINIGLGAVLGLLIGIGAAMLREALDTTIRSPESLERVTGAALLGSLYFDPLASKSPLVISGDQHAPRIEAFRVLRTNLQYLDVDHDSKVFVITSALPGAGKTTTSINIAITLAQAGVRTVLVEADLRRPKFAEYLNLEGSVGLTTVLSHRIGLDEAIQPWGSFGLDVINSGAVPPNPAELLQSKAMGDLLNQLRDRYDVIIVDSPPLLPVTDAALLAPQGDSTILIVHYGHTTKDQASQSVQRLQSVGVKLQATVLNWVPGRGADGYGYGYGYAPDPAVKATIDTENVEPVEPALPRDATDAQTTGHRY